MSRPLTILVVLLAVALAPAPAKAAAHCKPRHHHRRCAHRQTSSARVPPAAYLAAPSHAGMPVVVREIGQPFDTTGSSEWEQVDVSPAELAQLEGEAEAELGQLEREGRITQAPVVEQTPAEEQQEDREIRDAEDEHGVAG